MLYHRFISSRYLISDHTASTVCTALLHTARQKMHRFSMKLCISPKSCDMSHQKQKQSFFFLPFFGCWSQIKQTTLRQMLYDCMQPNYHSTGRTKCNVAKVLLCARFQILARAEHASRGRKGATVNVHSTTYLGVFPLPAFISLCAAHDTLRSTRSPSNHACNFRRKQSLSMEPSHARCSPNLSRCQPLKGKSICHRLNNNW